MRWFDLTDAQWARLEPLLPKWTKRQLIDGIRWRIRVGAPWRDVPECYGSWQAVYGLFRRWQRADVWQEILTRLQALADAAGLIGWQVGVDSTIVRAHPRLRGIRYTISPSTTRPHPHNHHLRLAHQALKQAQGCCDVGL